MMPEWIGAAAAVVAIVITVVGGLMRMSAMMGAFKADIRGDVSRVTATIDVVQRDVSNVRTESREESNRQRDAMHALRSDIQAVANRMASEYVHVGRFEAAVKCMADGINRIEDKLDDRLVKIETRVEEKMDKGECNRIHAERERG